MQSMNRRLERMAEKSSFDDLAQVEKILLENPHQNLGDNQKASVEENIRDFDLNDVSFQHCLFSLHTVQYTCMSLTYL